MLINSVEITTVKSLIQSECSHILFWKSGWVPVHGFYRYNVGDAHIVMLTVVVAAAAKTRKEKNKLELSSSN